VYCLSFLCYYFIHCSLYYSLPSAFIQRFFFIHAFSQISYLVSSYYTFVLIYSLSFDISIYLSIQLFMSSFVLQPILNFFASYSLCNILTSSFHYIFFLIFHLLIICPLTILVFPSVSFFLYTSFKRILCVALLRNRSVLMSIRCQFKCISEINIRLKLWFLRLQRLPTVDTELPPQGLFHHRKAHIPCEIQTLDPRVWLATFKFLFY
jgi:hypothetical protein